ncbi:type II toxin-antitoxin system RelE/ParE family toxin [Mariprofundus sp. EBB-1]|uniref:type II toxin-antitoxin system RelE/ParE family toxin n=1 Tax=Mariprofundus sp. EBB-1 TaxID=2650971 RepID=UPI000EF203D1|nr:type II toxin-antitoxin system RelE/ParE family toxin [Mariprofundus sp. EBB-1]RLL54068.1 type II toxin-antitoxin system RelE/ParE family toxin [Mariprofundus sp. EBB-1]
MPACKVKLSDLAVADLVNIENYTAKTWGEAQADKYLAQLEQRINWLAGHVQLGRSREDIEYGLFSFPEGHHIVFYRLNGSLLEVARILHESMDVTQQLSS